MRHSHHGAAALVFLLALAAGPRDASAASELDACASLAPAPDAQTVSSCLYDVARGSSPERARGVQSLEALRSRRPEDPWPVLYLAHLSLRISRELDQAEILYRDCARLASRRGMIPPEVHARIGTARLLQKAGRLEEAAEELKTVVSLAEKSGSVELQGRAAMLSAQQDMAEGELEQAYSALSTLWPSVRSSGSWGFQREYLSAFSGSAQQTGRLHEALKGFRELSQLAAAHGDAPTEISGLAGFLNLRLDALNEMPSAADRIEILAMARKLLAAARATERPALGVNGHWLLGMLAPLPEARVHLQRCVEVASSPQQKSFCHGTLALRLAPSDPAAADAAIHEAMTQARQSGDPFSWAAFWHQRMRMSWSVGPPESALRDSWEALDAIEALRDLQHGTSGQPRLFSTWAEDYYWLSGKLLELNWTEDAFLAIERMRARTLIDALGLPRSSKTGSSRPSFASLEQVRRALGPDEAFLSFQVSPWTDLAGDFGGGSWLLVTTRKDTKTYQLPCRTEVRPSVDALQGLVEDRNKTEAVLSATLYRELLDRALADLPEETKRLVIVPDDSLHRLPFALLRPEDGEPLGAIYQISLVPSATLWLRFRGQTPSAAEKLALVFADPPPAGSGASAERGGAFVDPASLGPLPGSKREGESVLRHLGRGSLLLTGAEASEAHLKATGLDGFRIGHFATHSVADSARPERSFIYLAAGDLKQDGQLHPHEIAELGHLRGKMVVLSTCESGAGEILRGEGVMGLARSFFVAGANPVVASLWRVRDDEGLALFDRFYAHLARGESVAAALKAAQRDLIDDGAPAAAWAGVVVLGDGSQVPFPEGRKAAPRMLVSLVGAVTLLTAVVLILKRRNSSSRV